MKNQLVVTEGKFDSEFMRRLLMSIVREGTEIVHDTGWTGAVSLARSYYLDGNNRILLLIQADTVNEAQVHERERDAERSMRMVVANSEYKIVVFVPELEGLFFRDKNFIESYFDTKLTDREFEMCQRDPSGWIMQLSGGKSFQNVREDMLAKMTDELQSKILEDPQMKEIVEYLK